ncbi:hypothetical protein DICVIV_07135 [Dictyocaulus viviparus]|uniref:Uncharacterized protein n=1 Tax=Dictyocaulus viviparus TaxID=29172 RepID=A0A0D8XST5_DICVI|nr:hypothetical protein DICVIV_07135 [Dictyocaulus viviparus]
MVKMCASGKRKVKATKAMPTKWRQMDDRQRTFILAHLSIPREIVKCCGPCFKRISKKLDLLFAGDLQEEMSKFELEVHQTWQSEENLIRVIAVFHKVGFEFPCGHFSYHPMYSANSLCFGSFLLPCFHFSLIPSPSSKKKELFRFVFNVVNVVNFKSDCVRAGK